MFKNWNTKLNVALSLALVLAMAITVVVLADQATDQSISINNGDDDTNSLSVSIYVSVLHCPPGGDMKALEVAFRNDSSESWSVVHSAGTDWPGSDADGCTAGVASPASFSWTLSAGSSGTRTVFARFKHASDEVFAQDDINFNAPPSDTTPPVITPNVIGTLGNNSWYTSDVTVSWTVEDEESEITEMDGCDPTTVNTDTTGTTLTCSATSAGGTSSESVTIKRDATEPTMSASVSPDRPVSGWWNITSGAPTVSFICSDATSGLAGACPADHLFGEGENQSYSQTIYDNAGNSASAGVTDIDVDLTAPTISASVSPDRPVSGWWNITSGAPTVSFICNDTGGSGLAGACPASVTLGNGGDQSVSGGPISDVAGNSSGVATISDIDVDLDAPTITASISPDASGTGWYNLSTGAPTVSFTCGDATSGIASCPDTYMFGEGADQSYSGTAYDNAGNSASAGVTNVDVDLTAPSISAALDRAPAASGWFNIVTGAPVAEFTCSDGTSGIASCPVDFAFGEGESQSHSGTAYDNAGNSASAEVSDIDVDLTAPTLTWNGGPADGGSYYFGFVPAAPTCTAADALSGPDGCEVTGYAITVGSHTMTAIAHDVAGNSGSEYRTYTVLAWDLKGFYQPVDMGGVFNVVKGGSTVPLKFEIFAGSTELKDPVYVESLNYGATDCVATVGEDVIETVATGGTSLRYDETSGQFIFNWKTPKTTGCYRVTLKTDDGSTLVAYFKIK